MSTHGLTLFAVVAVFLGCGHRNLTLNHTSENPKLGIARAITQILERAHRSGSIVYGGGCDASSQAEPYPLPDRTTLSPMDQALDRIQHVYPNITWIDNGPYGVRIIDRSLDTGLLNLRVKQFRIRDAATVQVAISAIWNVPEVKTYAAVHRVTFVGDGPGILSGDSQSPTISLQMEDATIAEIMDRISREYKPNPNQFQNHVWIYHECNANGELVVELDVM